MAKRDITEEDVRRVKESFGEAEKVLARVQAMGWEADAAVENALSVLSNSREFRGETSLPDDLSAAFAKESEWGDQVVRLSPTIKEITEPARDVFRRADEDTPDEARGFLARLFFPRAHRECLRAEEKDRAVQMAYAGWVNENDRARRVLSKAKVSLEQKIAGLEALVVSVKERVIALKDEPGDAREKSTEVLILVRVSNILVEHATKLHRYVAQINEVLNPGPYPILDMDFAQSAKG